MSRLFFRTARFCSAGLCFVLPLITALAPLARSFPPNQTSAGVAQAGPKVQDLEPMQGYLDSAPGGMDVDYAWTLPGGSGENVRIIDIEFNWNLNHSDLKTVASNLLIYVPGVDPDPADDVNHGTAVLGELAAADNGFGVTGIANQAQFGLINPQISQTTLDIAGAIDKASSLLQPGDLILVELQMIGPNYQPETGHGLVPVEFNSSVFAAVKRATSKGIVVVEPATNGAANLDDPIYQGAFDRNQRDSGAILVGAGKPPSTSGTGADRAPLKASDYGSRVDLQGWGKSVVTCGYGDLRLGKGQNNWYTKVFGETSGATAMVAGAAAVLESIVKGQNNPPLSPQALRQLLSSTGSVQTGNLSRNIGPRPDLRNAITALNQ